MSRYRDAIRVRISADSEKNTWHPTAKDLWRPAVTDSTTIFMVATLVIFVVRWSMLQAKRNGVSDWGTTFDNDDHHLYRQLIDKLKTLQPDEDANSHLPALEPP